MRELLALQETDLAILRLGARREALESGDEVAAIRAAFEQAENHLGELRLRRDTLASEQRRLEADLDMQGQRLKAEEARLYDGSVTNMKELEAIQHEIAGIKDRRGRIEDELLERMEAAEQLDSEIAEAERTVEVRRDEADRAAAEAATELTQVQADLETESAERTRRAGAVDPELLDLYEDIRRHKKGVGAAALVDGVCQGCHEALSPMELDRLKHADGIARCENCRRILVP